MTNHSIIPICLAFAIAPFSVLASSVVINEVMFDPAGGDTGGEWVELFNTGDEDADVSGWEIYPDGTGYVTIPNGFSIGAKKFMLIHLRSSGNNSPTDVYQTNASSNMSNTSGSAALFSAEPRGNDTMKSFVQWGKAGETWESDAEKAGLWSKGTFIDLTSFSEGNSLALMQDGQAGGGKNAWHISTVLTPKAANTGGSSGSPSPVPSSSSSPSPTTESSTLSSPATPRASPIKTIKAYAGEDVHSMVGAMISFLGRAKGIADESLDSSARFFWNFGDGETQEGRSVAHTYRIPGTYLAGLHVTSGEYAASDYIRVQVGPNLVSISDVIWGTDGYLRLKNSSDIEADIAGWNIRDAKGYAFVVPSHTMMARHGDVAIMNSVTGLLQDAASLPLTVSYPNGIVAFTYTGTARVSVIQPIQKEMHAPETQDGKSAAPAVIVAPLGLSGIQQPSDSPTPFPQQADVAREKESASVPLPISLPFGIAVGVSMLGAVGFLVGKQFLS